MAQDLSIDDPKAYILTTCRTLDSKLWFLNNPILGVMIRAFLAKYQEKYGVEIYEFELMGNHYHLISRFPNGNRANFLRDFDAMIAKLVISLVPGFEGKVWARRARCQVLLEPEDVKHWFFYVAMNPIISGVCRSLSEYAQYSGFADAISGQPKKYKIFNKTDYNNRIRYNKHLTQAECTSEHKLVIQRLPGYEHLSQREYWELMQKEFAARREVVVRERLEQGLGFSTLEQQRAIKPGARPRRTKTSSRDTHRPLCLTLNAIARKAFLTWYFSVVEAYKEASRRFRAGELTVRFPPGTYRPSAAVGFT